MKHKNTAYINSTALENNFKAIKKLVVDNTAPGKNPPKVISVVKADAYGHGIDIAASVLGSAGCGYFAVSSEEEAAELRRIEENNGREPEILILSRISPENVGEMIEKNITAAVTSPENAEALAEAASKTGKRLKIHVKLDTGMNRVGFPVREGEFEKTSGDIAKIAENKNLNLCGTFTHFSSADDELLDGRLIEEYRSRGGYTIVQLERFREMIDRLKKMGVDPGLVHAANSAAILSLPEAYFDAVRAGIIIYGLMPNGSLDERFTPVMRLDSTVTHIHEIKKGERVSYGAVFTAERDMTLATISAGYADGFERAYTGCEVEIHGKKYRQVGRICMDQFMADITGAEDVNVGDSVTLFGGDGGESTNALANLAGTINYEVVCKVSKRVTRVEC